MLGPTAAIKSSTRDPYPSPSSPLRAQRSPPPSLATPHETPPPPSSRHPPPAPEHNPPSPPPVTSPAHPSSTRPPPAPPSPPPSAAAPPTLHPPSPPPVQLPSESAAPPPAKHQPVTTNTTQKPPSVLRHQCRIILLRPPQIQRLPSINRRNPTRPSTEPMPQPAIPLPSRDAHNLQATIPLTPSFCNQHHPPDPSRIHLSTSRSIPPIMFADFRRTYNIRRYLRLLLLARSLHPIQQQSCWSSDLS